LSRRDPAPAAWLHPDVTVGASAIAGRGLFVSVDVTAGALLARFDGPLVTDADLVGNHSCDPNLGWADAHTLVALRDIRAGEELTCDYATAIVDSAFLLRCHCETYRCRQMVTGDDWRITELQKRYAGRWTPYVQGFIDRATGS
jgi:hypothetical protein